VEGGRAEDDQAVLPLPVAERLDAADAELELVPFRHVQFGEHHHGGQVVQRASQLDAQDPRRPAELVERSGDIRGRPRIWWEWTPEPGRLTSSRGRGCAELTAREKRTRKRTRRDKCDKYDNTPIRANSISSV